ncbi:restriction endonuclease [bacterium]|nr:restriction endonuclease [bacterium]MBU1638375.1 restriction endonuclease [bacterium]
MEIKDYFEKQGRSKFSTKNRKQQKVINEAAFVLDSLGIPVERLTQRRLERMAVVFLAVIEVYDSRNWSKAKDLNDGRSLTTREIIPIVNEYFSEEISSGSYDDIRRRDLEYPLLSSIIVPTKPSTSRNDPGRGYALSSEYSPIVRKFGAEDWNNLVNEFLKQRETLSQSLVSKRVMSRVPVVLPDGKRLDFDYGKHNELIKAVIEEFLPRYGNNAEVYYVGSAEDRMLHYEEAKLREMKFYELTHAELPDVIAFSKNKNWLYLIEAVHSANPISAERHFKLKQLTSKCTAGLIYITAFNDKKSFRRFAADISWETEVWIASDPDHVIHFDGERFLGPYTKNK